MNPPLTPPPSSGENIDDEDVPLIDGPKTGVDSSASHMVAIAVVAGAALLLFLLLLLKKRKIKEGPPPRRALPYDPKTDAASDAASVLYSLRCILSRNGGTVVP